MQLHRNLCKYSALFLALHLGGCSYILPESPSAPRYNTVMGERRVPMLNAQSAPMAAGVANGDAAAPMQVAQSAPSFPPVDAATKARAEQEMAAMALPPAVVAPTSDEVRRVPVENMSPAAAPAPMVVSQNNASPEFTSVPPRPAMTGNDSAAARLSKVRAVLEQDRAKADAEKAKLARDAAAEPSMLPLPEPTGAVPPSSSPTNTVAPAVIPSVASATMPSAPQSSNITIPPGVIAQPPRPVFAPPPPPMQMGSAPSLPPAAVAAPVARISAPPQIISAPLPAPAPSASTNIYYPPVMAAAPTPAPIQLRPPSGDVSIANVPPPPFRATPAPWSEPQPLPPAVKGGFDPLAGTMTTASNQATTIYGGKGYLPDSRYSFQR